MAGATLFERTKDSTMLNNTFGITNISPNIDVSEEYVRQKETQILEVGKNFKKDGKAKDLADLIRGIRPFLGQISKAKAAKLVKTLIDMFLDLEAGIGIEADLCRECIDWARIENRTFLRQSLEARLILLYIDSRLFTDALHVCNKLLKELKKIDDKNLLVEVLLYESKTYHGLGNLSKSRASLTSARTTANSIYCPPKLQAALDLQSGVLHAADEQDFKTAFSYFYEAFEGYDSVDSNKAVIALKYMLLTKVMLNLPEDVQQLIGGKLGLKYKGRNIEAMKSIAQASHKRSLAGFKESLKEFKVELVDDPIVYEHLDALYDNLLEQNLCRIIEPFSRVEVQFVAEQIKLSAEAVERKLSQMILDKKIPGILDQGEGILIVYEENAPDKTYEIVMDLITSMSKVVDTLYEKAKKLN